MQTRLIILVDSVLKEKTPLPVCGISPKGEKIRWILLKPLTSRALTPL